MNHALSLSDTVWHDTDLRDTVFRLYYHESMQLKADYDRLPMCHLPSIEHLRDYMYQEYWLAERMRLIQDAIRRNDDQMYGFATQESFAAAALRQDFNDGTLEPHINEQAIHEHIRMVLLDYHFFFMDDRHIIRNTPVKEVW